MRKNTVFFKTLLDSHSSTNGSSKSREKKMRLSTQQASDLYAVLTSICQIKSDMSALYSILQQQQQNVVVVAVVVAAAAAAAHTAAATTITTTVLMKRIFSRQAYVFQYFSDMFLIIFLVILPVLFVPQNPVTHNPAASYLSLVFDKVRSDAIIHD